MSSIDRRIVEMKFDNAEFQKRTEQTVRNLADLEKALQFDGAKKGTGDLQKALDSVNLNGIADGVESVSSRFNALGVIGATVLNSLTTSALNAGKSLVSSLVEPIFGGGKRRALNLEQAKFQLEGLKVAWEDISPAILNSVEDTAFGLDEAAKAAAMFAASNIPLEKMEYSLRAISGVAALTSSEYSDISNVFTKVAGQGRVMADDLNRLASRGMNAAATLAEHFGVTEAELRDMVSKGKVSFDDFALAMDNAFGEHAKKANETFSGSMANMRAALARIGADFYTIRHNNLRDIFNAATPAINAVKKALEPVVELYEELTTANTGRVVAFFERIVEPIEASKRHFEVITDIIRNLDRFALSIIRPIGEAFREVFSFEGVGDSIFGVLDTVRSLTANLELSEGAATRLKNVFITGFSAVRIVLDLVGIALTFVWEMAQNVAAFLEGLFTGSEVDSTTESVDGLSDSLGRLREKLSTVAGWGEIFRAAGKKVREALATVGDALKAGAGWFTENFKVGDIFTAILGVMGISSLKQINEALDRLVGWLRELTPKQTTGFRETIKQVGDTVGDVLDKVSAAVSTFVMSIRTVSLVAIASALLLLAVALEKIAALPRQKLFSSLAGIAALLLMLSGAFGSFNRTLGLSGARNFITASLFLRSVASSINTLADAVVTMGDMDFDELAKGLLGVFALLSTISGFLSRTSFTSLGVGTAASIWIISQAITDLVEPIEELSDLSWGEMAKGLSGIYLGLMAITNAIGPVSKMNKLGSLTGAASILIVAQSLGEIAEALAPISEIEWGGLLRGVSGIGLVLAEMGIVLSSMGRAGGLKNIAAATAVLIAAQSLGEIAEALAPISEIEWDGLLRGVSGIGLVLVEMGVVLSLMGLVGGIGAAISSVAIVVAAESLEDIAKALRVASILEWDRILRGVSGIGLVLLELGVVLSIMGAIAPLGSIFGAGALVIAVGILEEIGVSLRKASALSWDRILRGMAGIGGVLLELGVVLTLMGAVAPVGSVIGAAALVIAVETLDDIGAVLHRLSFLDWDDISRALVAIGGVLVEIGAVSVLMGGLAPLASIIGAGSLLLVSESLEPIADTLIKLSRLEWDEVEVGLKAMGSVLSTLAYGSIINSLSFLGAGSIAKLALPLGDLADSVKKWSGVVVPEGIETSMKSISKGVQSFNWAFVGSWTIGQLAGELGRFADDVKKWSNVNVPDDIGPSLTRISEGVKSFNWAFMGAWSIGQLGGELGILADDMRKWSNVDVPPNIGAQLEELAAGVRAFDWAFLAGLSISAVARDLGNLADEASRWEGVELPTNIAIQMIRLAAGVHAFDWAFLAGFSISAVARDLGNLADEAKRWTDVDIPMNIAIQMTRLASGVHAFDWAFLAGFSISVVARDLGNLADEAKRWADVDIPMDIGIQMIRLAAGVESFSWLFLAGWSLSALAHPLGELADSVRKWADISIPLTIEDQLKAVARGIDEFPDVTMKHNTLGALTPKIADLADAVAKWNGVVFPASFESQMKQIADGMQSLADTPDISKVLTNLENLAEAVKNLPNSTGGIDNLSGRLTTFADTAAADAGRVGDAFDTLKGDLDKAIGEMMNSLQNGARDIRGVLDDIVKAVNDTSAPITTAGKAVGAAAGTAIVDGLRSQSYTVFAEGVKIGVAMTDGMRSGLSRGSSAVSLAARTVANNAVRAAKNALGIASPAKAMVPLGEWFDEGFIKGTHNKLGAVRDASRSMAKTALESVRDALHEPDVGLFDDSLVLTPVLDLSEVAKDARALNSMLDSSIGGTYSRVSDLARIQNGSQNDSEFNASPVTNVNLVQNNHSPKALSTSDIYRRTNNQLSIAKESLTAHAQ